MTIHCLTSEAHRTFRRRIEVVGPTFVTIDEHGDPIRYEECKEFRQVRSFSEILCASCNTKPVITIV